MNKQELSKCCNKPKVANYSDEGTGCYLCQGCLGEFIPKKEECNFCRTSKCGNRNENCYCPCHSPVLEEEKSRCDVCDLFECNCFCKCGLPHDQCVCGWTDKDFVKPQEPMEWESEFDKEIVNVWFDNQPVMSSIIKQFISSQIEKSFNEGYKKGYEEK